MVWSWQFVFKSILLGIGLAMDAFSVSLVNGLNEPKMSKIKMCGVAGMFAALQFLMPLAGWFCVHSIMQYFAVFESFIPWIAFLLLALIGGKMLMEGIKSETAPEKRSSLTFKILLMQGIATSIDALSVGFTIVEYGWLMAFVCAFIIGTITFMICIAALLIGKTFGTKLSDKAQILGGILLIIIGLEIFITGMM